MTTPIQQVPGLYRSRIGDALVTTVNDGFLDCPAEIWNGASQEQLGETAADNFRPWPPRITVNTFVIEIGERTVLVDTGGGNLVESMGLLAGNLRAGGFAPDRIDTVLITHIHPDHTGGLLDADGERCFPNAEVVIAGDEIDFWSSRDVKEGRFAAATPYLGTATAVLQAYAGQIRRGTGKEIAPGLSAVPLPGHTPGHSGYSLKSAGESLLIWGDTVHAPEVQVPLPQVTSEFDVDQAQAAESRRRLFAHVAAERLLVAGMHLGFPAFAHVVAAGAGYRLIPQPWKVEP